MYEDGAFVEDLVGGRASTWLKPQHKNNKHKSSNDSNGTGLVVIQQPNYGPLIVLLLAVGALLYWRRQRRRFAISSNNNDRGHSLAADMDEVIFVLGIPLLVHRNSTTPASSSAVTPEAQERESFRDDFA